MEDGDYLEYLINQINNYKFNNDFEDILEQSKMINELVGISDLDEYIGITEKTDIINVSSIFIKLSSYLYTINIIRMNKLYKNYIEDNVDIVDENCFLFNMVDEIDCKKQLETKTFLIVYFKILSILDNNENYNNEYQNTINNINQILVY